MNKKIASTIVFVSLFCISSLAFAQSIVNPLNTDSFGQLLSNIGSQVGLLIAGLGTIMLIIAGIMYLLSAGEPEKMNRAKTALIYAIIGIVIGLASGAIIAAIKYVLGTKS